MRGWVKCLSLMKCRCGLTDFFCTFVHLYFFTPLFSSYFVYLWDCFLHSCYILFGVEGAGHQKWLGLAWKGEPQTLQLDCWTHGCSQMLDLRAPSWPLNLKHICSHATPYLLWPLTSGWATVRTAAHSDAASPPFQLGARLHSCQADALSVSFRQSGMKYKEQSDSLLCFCKYDFNASEAFFICLFCFIVLFAWIIF